MNVTCSAPVCPVILNSSCVFYEGESLIYTGINTNDSLQVALQKIDAALGLTTVVNIYNSDGVLTGNRTVSMNSYTLNFEKDVFIYNARVGRGAGAVVTNTVLGNSTLSSNTTGQYNTAVGISALNLNTTGNYNTALGAYSLSNATTAEGNTGLGTSAMTFLTTGYSNTAVGFGALYKVVDGYQNVAIGRSALYELISGNQNIGIGLSAGSSLTTGSKNTIIGWGSGQAISTGSSNTIIGANVSALASTTSNNIIIADGDGNIQIRDDGANTILPRLAGTGTRLVVTNATGALSTQPIPTGNITGSGSLGQVAFFTGASSIGGNNTLYWDSFNGRLGVGTNTPNRTFTVAGSFAVTGGNISITNTIPDGDIVIGSTNFLQMGSTRFRGNGTDFEFKDSGTNTTRALIATGTNISYFNSGGNYHFGGSGDDGINRLQVTGSAKITSDSTINDISVGKGGGSIATNTRVGSSALSANTTGTSNVAFGNSSMFNNTTGINNVVVGTEALYTSTIGSNNNVIVGRQAAYYCTAIVDSIAVGAAALSNALNSQRNVAIGRQSMINSVSGNDNTALGYRALYGAASSTYANNTGIGSGALGNMLSGGNNTAIGFESGAYAPNVGSNNTTSTNSIYVGYRAAASANGNTNEIIIGYDTAGNGSNTTTLGNSSTVGTYLRGKTILAASATARASLNITTGVAPTTPTDGDVWSTTTDLLARINGTTYSLINSGLSGSGAAGQVTYWSSATNITGSNNLFWDNANSRLGIGTTPATALDVTATNPSTTANITHITTAGNSTTKEVLRLSAYPTAFAPANGYGVAQSFYSVMAQAANSNGEVGRFEISVVVGTPTSVASRRFDFKIKGNVNTDPLYNAFSFVTSTTAGVGRFEIPTSNLVIGNTGDGGQRLQVYGTALFTGSVVGTGNSTTYSVTASSALAVSKSITSTLIAAANNDVLVALDVRPTFTNGAFTGVTNYAIRTNGETLLKGTTNSTGNALTVQQFSGVDIFTVRNDGFVSVPNGSFFAGSGPNGFTINSSSISNGILNIQNDRLQLRVNAGPVYVYNQGDSSAASLILMGGRDGANANFAPVIIGSGLNASLSRETMRIDNQNQSVLVGTVTNVASSIVTMASTTKGFLPPRMTVAQRTAITTPAEGLIVFQTDGVIGLYVYANAAWRSLTMV